MMLKVRDVMKKDLITVREDASMLEAINILAENKITALLVVNAQNRLVGVISEKDVLSIAYKVMAHSYEPGSNGKKVSDLMTKDVVTFRPDDNLADVCQCLMNRSFRRVPIVEDGKLIGLISRKDIVSYAFSKIT